MILVVSSSLPSQIHRVNDNRLLEVKSCEGLSSLFQSTCLELFSKAWLAEMAKACKIAFHISLVFFLTLTKCPHVIV